MKVSSKISMVVFDMAGTVINESNVVYKTIHKALLASGYEIDLPTVMKYAGGTSKLDAIRKLITLAKPSSQDSTTAESVHQVFSNMLTAAYEEMEIIPFQGVGELLSRLRKLGIRVVLSTGFDRPTATGILNKIGWKKDIDFDLLVTNDDVLKGRPAPDMIHLAMNKLKISDPEKVVKVGDSVIDIEAGHAAGCGLSIAVTTGVHEKAHLASARPHYIIDNLENLDDYFSRDVAVLL